MTLERSPSSPGRSIEKIIEKEIEEGIDRGILQVDLEDYCGVNQCRSPDMRDLKGLNVRQIREILPK
jgi:hypothetical protein